MFENFKEEIKVRINRETSYVLALADVLKGSDNTPNRLEAKKLLLDKIEDNNKTLKIINEFICTYKRKDGENPDVEWEKFYKEKYWGAS